MGDVYLATREGLGGFKKFLVLKELRPSLASDPRFVEMFLEEARLAGRLEHPNVVQTLEIVAQGSSYFIVMEYLDGQPLQRVLGRFRQRGGLPLAAGLHILAEALAGLHYAHELADYDGKPLGIVHRDVSPHNVFVTYEGQVKIVDFGIAKAVDSAADTRLGILKGKVAYMAPEQARGEPLDRRADVYSAGVILWEIVTGTKMWGERSELEILTRLAAGDLPDLARAALDPELAAIGAQALGAHRDQRYPTAAAFRHDLLRCLSEREFVGSERLAELIGEGFREERARFRDRLAERLAHSAPFSSQNGALDPGLGPSSSQLAQGPYWVTPSPVPAASGLRSVHDSETVVVPALGGRTTRGRVVLALGGLILLVAAAWLAASHAGEPATAMATSKEVVRRPVAGAAAERSSSACTGSGPLIEVSGDIVSDSTLTCDKSYLLRFTTFVKSGVTLTIEKGTTVYGDTATRGTLVVQPGARLVARGTPEAPIVFTSERSKAGQPRPGDWGGVILLGRAPLNLRREDGRRAHGRVEGITSGGDYGGDNPDDDSGALEYVRIEWSGTELGPNNEINGLTLGGVGSRTVLHHVQVRDTADDCYEFFGGTVNGKYLGCLRPGDDGFDWDYGYRGKLQFLLLLAGPVAGTESNGLEGDNDPNASTNQPVSEPTIYNATLCGPGKRSDHPGHGMLLRRSTRARIANTLVSGFDFGLDVRDPTSPDIRSTAFFGNLQATVAAPERSDSEGPLSDDDLGFDEIALVAARDRRNLDRDPGLGACTNPDGPRPKRRLDANAEAPPADGFFDPEARYLGAFADEADDWGDPRWIPWR